MNDTITPPAPPRFAGLLNLVFGFGMLAAFVTASVLGIQWVRANGAPEAQKANVPFVATRCLPVPDTQGLFVRVTLGSNEPGDLDRNAPSVMRSATVAVENGMVVVRVPVGKALHSYSSGGPEIAGAKVGNPDE